MPTRMVTGTIFHADGTPWQGAEVAFLLMAEYETGAGVYPVDEVTTLTDASGNLSVNLSVPSTGTAYYQVRIPGRIESYDVYLPDGAATTLQSLLTIATTSSPPSALQTLLDAAAVLTVVNKVGPYVIQASDEVIRCNGTFTVTLPPATGSGVVYCVKNVGVGVITLDADGADLIDGAGSLSLAAKASAVVLDAAAGVWDEI